MATPHIGCEKQDIAPVVLMPGDPLRAKYIAENFLENPKLVNEVRNMFGYTGTYKGKRVTVFASGMGIPSIGIYAYELYKYYDVETIVRIGTCGSFNPLESRRSQYLLGMATFVNSFETLKELKVILDEWYDKQRQLFRKLDAIAERIKNPLKF